MVYFYCGFLKVLVGAGIDVHHFLGIAVNQRKPAALNLDHDAVAFFEGVGNVVHREFYVGDLARDECFRYLEAVPVTPTHDIAADQHLVTIHDVGRLLFVGIRLVFKIVREYINQFDNKIGIRR